MAAVQREHNGSREDAEAAYLILQSVEAFEDELKHGVEVVRARRCHKDIGVAVNDIKKSFATTAASYWGNMLVFEKLLG